MPLRIHALYHVDFEKLGYIEQWASNNGHSITTTRFYENDKLPDLNSFDWLIIMGGPMGIYEEASHPWLIDEKKFIKNSIEAGKTVIGVCLGAQLIADCLGAKVEPSGVKEIGWMPIELTEQGKAHPILQQLPKEAFNVFHWHGDGFDRPKGSVPIATSQFWDNQGFIYQSEKHKQLNTWVMGWQCHFEVTPKSMIDMVAEGGDYIRESITHHPDSVQTPKQILALGEQYIEDNNAWLSLMLDNMANLDC